MLGAEVEHFLRLRQTADAGAGKAVTAAEQAEGRDRLRVLGRADEAERAVALQQLQIAVDVVIGRDAVEDEMELADPGLHRLGITGHHHLMGAEPLGVGALALRGGEEDDMGAEGPGELDAHMAEAAEADDADGLAGADLPMAQRRIGRDAGAEQRRRGGQIEIGRHLEREVLVDDDGLGIAAIGHLAGELVGAVIGARRPGDAILLQALDAVLARAAGVDEAADAGEIAFLELRDLATDAADAADDLMSGNVRIDGVVPFVAGGMQVGMADAAIEDLDLDILRARIAALEGGERERRGGRLRGIAGAGEHGRLRGDAGNLYRSKRGAASAGRWCVRIEGLQRPGKAGGLSQAQAWLRPGAAAGKKAR